MGDALAADRPVAPAQPASFGWGNRLLAAVVAVYLAVVLLLPLAALAKQALTLAPSQIAAELIRSGALDALRRSVLLAVAAVVLNGAFGIAGAIVLVRHRFAGRAMLDAFADLSLAVSPVMTGLAFLLLFGRGGWLQPLVEHLGVRVAFAWPALLAATLFVTLPFTLREVAYVLEELGTDDEEAAATLGASPWRTFRRVTLPNISHGLSLGVTLTAARALGEFGAVLVVGGGITGMTQTATTFIYTAHEERLEAAVFGMALTLALTSLLLLVVLQGLKRRKHA